MEREISLEPASRPYNFQGEDRDCDATLSIADLTPLELIHVIGLCEDAGERRHAARLLAIKSKFDGQHEALDKWQASIEQQLSEGVRA